jgi:dephospho-CoA kinase
MKTPIIIGITGGIGSGKSTLSERLREIGYSVYDSDLEARRLQNEHPEIQDQLIELFGEDIYNDQGLNRPVLAKLVFGKPELLAKLNAIVHPVVHTDFMNWIQSHSAENLLFMESAILFESGFNKMVDKVIVMTASEDIRIARVMKRDKVTEEQVKARMSHQMADDKKIANANFVIHSDDCRPLVVKMKIMLEELLKSLEDDNI